jgi:hypothetical protein
MTASYASFVASSIGIAAVAAALYAAPGPSAAPRFAPAALSVAAEATRAPRARRAAPQIASEAAPRVERDVLTRRGVRARAATAADAPEAATATAHAQERVLPRRGERLRPVSDGRFDTASAPEGAPLAR